MVRTTGFPVDGLLLLVDAELAAAADTLIDADAPGPAAQGAHTAVQENFEAKWRAHTPARQAAIATIVDRPDFVLALTWQNPRLLRTAIEPLRGQIRRGEPRNRKRRLREQVVVAYWQRYCAKTESIGFFGPTAWARVHASQPAIATAPGPGLTSSATVFLESWSVQKLAQRLQAEHDLRPWLAPRRAPHVRVVESAVVLPDGGRHPIDHVAQAVLATADGLTTAAELARQVAAAPSAAGTGITAEAAYETMLTLRRRGWLIWAVELSPGLQPEAELRTLLERVEPSRARLALAALDPFVQARAGVTEACLDAGRLGPALDRLDAAFVAATGSTTLTRNDGLAYGGRTLAYLECRRDIGVHIGAGVVDALHPLELVLDSIAWMLHEVRRGVVAALDEIWHRLPSGPCEPTAAMLWTGATGLIGSGIRAIVAEAADRLQHRWQSILNVPEAATRARFRMDELSAVVADAFAVPSAGWTDARWCSPDVMIAAPDEQAIRRGDFELVLGEVHASVNTFDYQSMVGLHPDPDQLMACLDADHPQPRLLVALPRESRPRLTTRSHPAFARDIDHHVVLLPHIPVPTRGRVSLGADIAVEPSPAGPQLRMANGQRFDAVDLFAGVLKAEVAQAFDVYPPGYRPRIVVDRLTLARERWSAPVAELEFAFATDEAQRYLGCRRWARRRGLPGRVFVKSPVETKPLYVDLAGPGYVEVFAAAVRQLRELRPAAVLTVTELLPELDRTWLPDRAGNRYVAEFRFVAYDGTTARHGRV
jgi:hypothetical protein